MTRGVGAWGLSRCWSPSSAEEAGSSADTGAVAAPPLSITELASLLAGSRAAVGVDTGLSHLAVALGTPTVALYVATDPGLTGVLGRAYFRNLGGRAQMPTPDAVLEALQPALA